MSAVEASTDVSNQPIILLADKLHPLVIDRLQQIGQVTVNSSLSGDELAAAMSDLNPRIVVVRSTKVQEQHINAAPNLGLIVRAGAGTNNIDKSAASARGIYVANCPGKNAIAVAELVFGHLINMDRRIADNVLALRLGQWSKKEFSSKSRGLYGRTIGVLGAAGQIGVEVCKRAKAFGMHVKGYDPFMSPQKAEELGIEYCASPLECAGGADALTVHVPLLESTKNLINEELLGVLNDGAYVINASRGGILDEVAMRDAIRDKGLKCGLDVYVNEPKASDTEFKDTDLSTNPHVYGTHHIGASTEQATEAVGEMVVEIIQEFLKKGSVKAVNMIRERDASFSVNVRHAVEGNVLVNVLAILAEDGLRVQQMENKIFSEGVAGSVRIQVDRMCSEAVLGRIREMEHVFSAEVGELRPGDTFFG